MEEYERWAKRIDALAAKAPGFISIKTFAAEDGERASIVEFESEETLQAWRNQPDHREALQRVCLFDLVANNADRKSGHCLWVPGDRVYAIDHGLTFHAEPKLRTVIWDSGQEPIAPALLEDLRRAIEVGLRDALAALLDADEQRALKRRARGMIRSGHFPVDQSGLRYPWPLV